MDTRNLTLNLPTDLIRQVKVYAAQHDTTINAFVRDLLQEVMSQQSRARETADRLLALTDQGLRFSADLQSFRRESIYERE